MPYRDDEADLLVRKAALEAELNALETQSREIKVLEWERRRELRSVEERAHTTRTRLPMLDSVRVAAPCNADWNAMIGDERVRFCEACEKNVYNLSALTSAQAEALLREKEGNLCVRLFRRKDGTVLTTDCSVGVKKRRVRNAIAGAIAAAGAAAGAATALRAPPLADTAEPKPERSTSAYFVPSERECTFQDNVFYRDPYSWTSEIGLRESVEATGCGGQPPPTPVHPQDPRTDAHHIFGRKAPL